MSFQYSTFWKTIFSNEQRINFLVHVQYYLYWDVLISNLFYFLTYFWCYTQFNYWIPWSFFSEMFYENYLLLVYFFVLETTLWQLIFVKTWSQLRLSKTYWCQKRWHYFFQWLKMLSSWLFTSYSNWSLSTKTIEFFKLGPFKMLFKWLTIKNEIQCVRTRAHHRITLLIGTLTVSHFYCSKSLNTRVQLIIT